MDDLAIEVRENKGIYYKVRYAILFARLGSAKYYTYITVEAV